MFRTFLMSPIVMLLAAFAVQGQTALPVVEDVEATPFRDHCRQLLRALDKPGSPVPAKTIRDLTALLDRKPFDAEQVQKLLDTHCLIAVSINAESRVKAARGPGKIELHPDRPALVLLKVHNEGGVTHALRLYGPELVRGDERATGRWLEAALITESPFAAELTGRRLEYRLLRLTARDSGKREATFQFDVGQGTQDLGFRAEVPILFTIRKK